MPYPLQWGHGREAMDGLSISYTSRDGKSFNGAMAVRPWMARGRHERKVMQAQLQWGHGREAMDGEIAHITPF